MHFNACVSHCTLVFLLHMILKLKRVYTQSTINDMFTGCRNKLLFAQILTVRADFDLWTKIFE